MTELKKKAIDTGVTFDASISVGEIALRSAANTLGRYVYNNANLTPYTVGGITAGSTFTDQNVTEVLNSLLYPYVAPSVVLSSVPAQGLREAGDDIAAVALTGTTTRHTNDITSVLFKRGAATIDTVAAPIAAGGAEAYNDAVGIPSTSASYTCVVGDGTATTTSNTLSFTFCYPFFYGVGAAGLNAAAIYAAFNPGGKIIQNQTNTTKAFAPVGQYYYFCYPATLPNLSNIYDQNGFDITADFTLRNDATTIITGLDGTAQQYKVYEFDNLTSLSQNLTFEF